MPGCKMPSFQMNKIALLLSLVLALPAPAVGGDLIFSVMPREIVEGRLKSFSRNDSEREAILKAMFTGAGCSEHISEFQVKHVKQPDLICVLPGESQSTIFVGAHFDHVDAGDGVVDNWSGASLLPSLYEGLKSKPVRHTFVFISFSGEELGELGSEAYVKSMSNDDVARSVAMINLDTLGLGPTAVWLSHADPNLARKLAGVAHALQLPISGVNVERVGSSDSEQFARRKVPRITIHSLTQKTLPILHSSRDKLAAMQLDDYYSSYRLLAAYLVYLDGSLEQSSSPQNAVRK
jgi:hypothetical protein